MRGIWIGCIVVVATGPMWARLHEERRTWTAAAPGEFESLSRLEKPEHADMTGQDVWKKCSGCGHSWTGPERVNESCPNCSSGRPVPNESIDWGSMDTGQIVLLCLLFAGALAFALVVASGGVF